MEPGAGLKKSSPEAPMPKFTVTDLFEADHPVRCRFVSLFCEAIYSDDDAEVASALVRDCLILCGGSSELFSNILQDKWLDDNTPLHWVVTNTRKTSHSHLPALLKALLDSCSPPLSELAKSSIEDGCRQEDNNPLFQTIEMHLLLRNNPPNDSAVFEDIVQIATKSKVFFAIPMFSDRILM
ncbi:hypothetical protein DFP72DRAFT_1060558 [Ephemerocybe angulata]|uniref:Uncharacterized protein n=1 Tax=Ephemerocybe angulata TaxID=980116 RepID=A0A8H6MCG8_9AGAR|nr:hypothetical protein DFP72DRAFT_1060558 [Tulosesus angulatus]